MSIDTIERDATKTIDPAGEAVTTIETLEIEGIELAREEIGDPDAFLSSDRGKAWLAPILSGAYFMRYYDGGQRSPYDIKTCNEIAGKILEAKYRGDCAETVLEQHFGFGQEPEDVYHEEHASDIETRISELASDISDLEDDTLPELDEEAWCEAVKDAVIDHMNEDDDTSVMDLIGSYDRFELVVRFDPEGNYVTSDASWPDFDRLCIDQALRNHLARLGYTVSDYRRMTGRTHERLGGKGKRKARAQVERTSGRVPVRGRPLLTEAQLRSLIEESCGQSSAIVLYASISLTQLVEIDLARPVVLSNCAIASYNSVNGTFFDVSCKEAVVLDPRHDRLTEAWGYRPENICGLYMPAYHAEMVNAG